MGNNENFVTEQVTENVEQTTEQTKTFTQADVDRMVKEKLDEVLPGKIARNSAKVEARIRGEYDREYGGLMDVLRAGTGKQTVGEITDSFKEHYTQQGVQLPQKPMFSDRDLATLAEKDAAEFINAGDDDVADEVARLEKLGADNMTDREKKVYQRLTQHRQNAQREAELAKLGVPEEVYKSAEFLNFAKKFDSSTPITDVYDIYRKTHTKETKPMGSMKTTGGNDTGVKEYYSREEAAKIKKEEYLRNPALLKAVENSMLKWK